MVPGVHPEEHDAVAVEHRGPGQHTHRKSHCEEYEGRQGSPQSNAGAPLREPPDHDFYSGLLVQRGAGHGPKHTPSDCFAYDRLIA